MYVKLQHVEYNEYHAVRVSWNMSYLLHSPDIKNCKGSM